MRTIFSLCCKTDLNTRHLVKAGAQRYILASVLAVVLMGLTAPGVHAQLKRFPLKRDASAAPVKKTRPAGNAAGRTQAVTDTLSLPFWDDFSFTPIVSNDTLLPSPLDSLWEQHAQVWVNNGMGLNPPSINVATFDGLNAKGATYTDQILYNGFRDTLTSRHIQLNTVPTAQRSSVFLSFAYQWQGNGEAPDRNDYMVVQFLNADTVWEEAMTIPFRQTLTRSEFRDTIIQIADDRFFHEGFQFRLLNYGRQSGPYDTWNIDYVYLNKGRSATDLFFPDRAISTPAGSFFEKYRTVPIHHFAQVQNTVPAPFEVYNAQGNQVSVNYQANATIVNFLDGVADTHPQNLGDSIPLGYAGDPPKGTSVLDIREHKIVATLPTPDITQLNFGADSARIDIEIILNSKDNVYKNLLPPQEPDSTGDYLKKYEPIDFRNNDTIRTQYNLAKYYAYDDGTAEYSAGLTQAGNRGAYLFQMLIPADTLVGFDIYFPGYGITGTVTTDFYVYADNNGVPGVLLYTLASRQVLNRGLNVFQRFVIGEPFVVTDKFYIGWKAPVGSVLPIGLDYSNDAGDKMFFNVTGTWEQNTDVVGSLMIRPVFGNNGTNVGLPEDPTRNVSVYPNPNTGSFYVKGDVDRVELMNIAGQPVSFQTDPTSEGLLLSADHAAPGLYILKIYKNNVSSTRKLVIR